MCSQEPVGQLRHGHHLDEGCSLPCRRLQRHSWKAFTGPAGISLKLTSHGVGPRRAGDRCSRAPEGLELGQAGQAR